MWLLRQGRSLGRVADVVGVHYRILQKWVAWYRQGEVAKGWLIAVAVTGMSGDVPVKLIEQRLYSSELNPAERVLEHLRNKIEGKVYGQLAAKKAAIEAKLAQLAAVVPNKAKRLAGWAWIQQNLLKLYPWFR